MEISSTALMNHYPAPPSTVYRYVVRGQSNIFELAKGMTLSHRHEDVIENLKLDAVCRWTMNSLITYVQCLAASLRIARSLKGGWVPRLSHCRLLWRSPQQIEW